MTRLWAGLFGVGIPAGARHFFSLLQNFQTGSGCRGIKLPAPRLRMSGDVLLSLVVCLHGVGKEDVLYRTYGFILLFVERLDLLVQFV